MKLIGRFMSPFTRRVAVSLKIQGLDFEHLDLSTATEADEIRKYNPMVRVPTVVLDDSETLVDSDAILDWFDEQSGPDKRLIPEKGEARRNVLQLVSWATAAGDKTVIAFYERTRRPEEMVYLPSVEGAEGQLLEAFGVLETAASKSNGCLSLSHRLSLRVPDAGCFEGTMLTLHILLSRRPIRNPVEKDRPCCHRTTIPTSRGLKGSP